MNENIQHQIGEIQVANANLAAKKKQLYDLCRACPHQWGKGEYQPTSRIEMQTVGGGFHSLEEPEEIQVAIEVPRWRHTCPLCTSWVYSDTEDGSWDGTWSGGSLFFDENKLKPTTQLALPLA